MRRRAWSDDPRLGRVPALLRGSRPSSTRDQEDTRHRREDNGWAYRLAPELPYYVGGYFWWYALEDVFTGKELLAGQLPPPSGPKQQHSPDDVRPARRILRRQAGGADHVGGEVVTANVRAEQIARRRGTHK